MLRISKESIDGIKKRIENGELTAAKVWDQAFCTTSQAAETLTLLEEAQIIPADDYFLDCISGYKNYLIKSLLVLGVGKETHRYEAMLFVVKNLVTAEAYEDELTPSLFELLIEDGVVLEKLHMKWQYYISQVEKVESILPGLKLEMLSDVTEQHWDEAKQLEKYHNTWQKPAKEILAGIITQKTSTTLILAYCNESKVVKDKDCKVDSPKERPTELKENPRQIAHGIKTQLASDPVDSTPPQQDHTSKEATISASDHAPHPDDLFHYFVGKTDWTPADQMDLKNQIQAVLKCFESKTVTADQYYIFIELKSMEACTLGRCGEPEKALKVLMELFYHLQQLMNPNNLSIGIDVKVPSLETASPSYLQKCATDYLSFIEMHGPSKIKNLLEITNASSTSLDLLQLMDRVEIFFDKQFSPQIPHVYLIEKVNPELAQKLISAMIEALRICGNVLSDLSRDHDALFLHLVTIRLCQFALHKNYTYKVVDEELRFIGNELFYLNYSPELLAAFLSTCSSQVQGLILEGVKDEAIQADKDKRNEQVLVCQQKLRNYRRLAIMSHGVKPKELQSFGVHAKSSTNKAAIKPLVLSQTKMQPGIKSRG